MTNIDRADVIRQAITDVIEFGTGSTVGELADMAHDLVAEETAIMDPADIAELDADFTRDLMAKFGVANDATHIPQADLRQAICECGGVGYMAHIAVCPSVATPGPLGNRR